MKTINHESDFKLLVGYSDGSPINEPFRLTFYTKVSRGTFIAEYNGSEYVNCYPDGGLVKIPFDKPMLGMGVLSVKIELFINDSDFADGKYDYVSVEPTGILLDKGATEPFEDMEVLISKPNTRGLEMFLSKPFTEGVGGGGEIPNGSVTEYKLANGAVSTAKIKDGSVTMAKLSDEVKNKFNQGGKIPEVIDEEIYFNDGSNKVVPIKHPDLSTQPSILPYKFMGQYVYERLIPISILDYQGGHAFATYLSRIGVTTSTIFIESSAITNIGAFPAIVRINGVYVTCIFNTVDGFGDPGELLYFRIVYSIPEVPEEGGDYYGYNNY